MEIETAFNGLMFEAEKTCCEHPDAEQVIAVKTEKGNTYILVNRNVMSGDYSDENSFIQMLREKDDTETQYLVCKWNGKTVDVPSFHFREQLLNINPKNENTALLLQGFGAYIVKPLKNTLPPSKGADMEKIRKKLEKANS